MSDGKGQMAEKQTVEERLEALEDKAQALEGSVLKIVGLLEQMVQYQQKMTHDRHEVDMLVVERIGQLGLGQLGAVPEYHPPGR